MSIEINDTGNGSIKGWFHRIKGKITGPLTKTLIDKKLPEYLQERVQGRENIKNLISEDNNKALVNNLFSLSSLDERKNLMESEEFERLRMSILQQGSKDNFISLLEFGNSTIMNEEKDKNTISNNLLLLGIGDFASFGPYKYNIEHITNADELLEYIDQVIKMRKKGDLSSIQYNKVELGKTDLEKLEFVKDFLEKNKKILNSIINSKIDKNYIQHHGTITDLDHRGVLLYQLSGYNELIKNTGLNGILINALISKCNNQQKDDEGSLLSFQLLHNSFKTIPGYENLQELTKKIKNITTIEEIIEIIDDMIKYKSKKR